MLPTVMSTYLSSLFLTFEHEGTISGAEIDRSFKGQGQGCMPLQINGFSKLMKGLRSYPSFKEEEVRVIDT